MSVQLTPTSGGGFLVVHPDESTSLVRGDLIPHITPAHLLCFYPSRFRALLSLGPLASYAPGTWARYTALSPTEARDYERSLA